MSANNPVVNNTAADRHRLTNGLQQLLRGKQLGVDGMLPARVVSYDRTKNTATIQPMIMYMLTDETTLSRKQIPNVPVLCLSGGGFMVNFPIKEGDLGWLHAADRDISLYLQNLSESAPPTGILHSFDSAMFIPDCVRGYTINSADSAAMVISTLDGTTRISVSNGNVTITAPTGVKVDTPNAEFTHNVTVDGNLTVTGQTAVNGGFSAAGSGGSGSFVTLPANTTINGITVATHGHISSNPGSRTSGNMIS